MKNKNETLNSKSSIIVCFDESIKNGSFFLQLEKCSMIFALKYIHIS